MWLWRRGLARAGRLLWEISYVYGIMQGEVEPGFGRDLHFLAMRYGLHDRAGARSCARSDGRAFAASGEAADDSAEHGASPDDFGGALAARAALFLNVAAGDLISPSLISEAVERNGEFAAALEFSGGAGVNKFEIYVESFGDDDAIADDNRRVKRCAKGLASAIDAGVDGIDGANGDDGAIRNGDGDGLRRRRQRRWCGSGGFLRCRFVERSGTGR